MSKRLIFLPILAFVAVLFAPASAFACGGAGQACCMTTPTCAAPAFCDTSLICVLPNRQACTSDSDCFFGHCADTSSTPSCGSLECLSAAGQACSADADCEPATWCSAHACTVANADNGTCAADGPRECISFLCNNMTQTCELGGVAPVGDGCIAVGDCQPGLSCCQKGVGGCAGDTCVDDDGAGWCCVPSGHGSCTVADEHTFCCSGSCNGGTGICN